MEEILSKSQETFERQHALKVRDVDLDYVTDRVTRTLEMKREHEWLPGKYKRQVTARSLLCFWAVRELREIA